MYNAITDTRSGKCGFTHGVWVTKENGERVFHTPVWRGLAHEQKPVTPKVEKVVVKEKSLLEKIYGLFRSSIED